MPEPRSIRPLKPSYRGTPELSDRELLRLFRQGSQSAAARLYERYAHRLRALVHAHSTAAIGTRCDAEDIVQSVFRRFFQRAKEGTYEVPASDELWNLFLVIALNRLRAEEAYHRAAKRDVRLTVREPHHGRLLDHLEQPDPAAVYLDLVIREALEHLPELHQQVVQLRIEGYEVAEIASKLGCGKRTVERALQESRKHLSVLFPDQS
jgi:RNA polymerase sigma-70 factor (ECF subfamily)